MRSTNYYDKLFDLANPDKFEECKNKRKIKGMLTAEKTIDFDGKRSRLAVMEECHEASAKALTRKLDI